MMTTAEQTAFVEQVNEAGATFWRNMQRQNQRKATRLDSSVESIRRALEDVVYAHADQRTFTTADVLPSRNAEQRSIIIRLLACAAETGAIRANGRGKWYVVDAEELYSGEFDRLVRSLKLQLGAFPYMN